MSSCTSMAGLRIILILPWVMVMVLRERVGVGMLVHQASHRTVEHNIPLVVCSRYKSSRNPSASSPQRIFKDCVKENASGAGWHLSSGLCLASAVGLSHQPHQGHQCHRPEQVFMVAPSHSGLCFVSGADGKPWRTWTER